jgi:hypothetical protein
MSGRARQAGATEAGHLGGNFQQACPIDNRFRGRQPTPVRRRCISHGSIYIPWVYIEEISGGQHNIATSIAAFIGWSNQGPVGEAVMVESWAQYETQFGGMIPGIYLGYAVYQNARS